MAETLPRPATLLVEGAVASITLERAERHNAFDDAVIHELAGIFARVAEDDTVRVAVLAATGPSFSAGADLQWMKRMASASLDENEADARRLADMLAGLSRLPQPTIALVQGPAYGGGVGLVAACDIAVCSTSATFAFPEVKLGLIPATIAPYAVAAIGARAASRYMLTGERFDAAEAHRIGLVHAVVAPDQLEREGRRLVEAVLANGPQAVKAAKRLIRSVQGRVADPALAQETARLLAEIRTGAEAHEGIAAFFGKRPPAWKGR